MAETGVLKPDARVELLDGEIIDLAPIGPFHGGSTHRLLAFFTSLSRGRWIVSVQNPLQLDAWSEPQPDLMLLRPVADYYTTRLPTAEDVLLLVEVSDTTLNLDREQKLPAYGRAGIREDWILNLVELLLEVDREPTFAGYSSRNILPAGDKARPLAFADAEIEVAELLRQG